MSLTKFIQLSTVKELIQMYYRKPKITLANRTMLAPPLTENYTSQGQAFDYLFRFHLGIRSETKHKPWVAEQAIPLIRAKEPKYMYQKAISMVNNTKNAINQQLMDELPGHAIRLSRLEQVARNGGRLNLRPMKGKDIQDLERLIGIVPWDEFKDLPAHMNPMFGAGSVIVGGADADFISGTLLVDIKTTKHLKYTTSMWNQLIGYATLNRIGGNVYKLKRMAIYFSRHGYLHTLDIPPLNREYVKQFKALAQDYQSHQWPYMEYLDKND